MERRNNNFPIWAVAFPTGLRCFVGHVALATLPSRALSDGKIPTPKTRTYYCDVPIRQKDAVSKVRILYCAEGEFSAPDGAHFVLLLLFRGGL